MCTCDAQMLGYIAMLWYSERPCESKGCTLTCKYLNSASCNVCYIRELVYYLMTDLLPE